MTIVGRSNSEAYFFKRFIELAIQGDEKYIDILKPVLLDAASYARKEITIWQVSRDSFEIKLKLQNFPFVNKITEDNLYFKELLEFLNNNSEFFEI